MTIEQRIEALERRCKRLGKTLVGVGTLALFAVVAGTAGWTVAYTGSISPSSITTSSIFLKDKTGKKRLSLHGNSGTLYAKDSAGKTRVRLGGSDGSVTVYDKAGKAVFALRGSDSILNVNDSAGKTRIRL